MKKFFKKVKSFFANVITTIKSLFTCDENEPPVNTGSGTTIVDVTEEEEDFNEPFDKDNIKNGEIGAYIIFDKSKGAVVTNEFIDNLKKLGIDILYFNTPRNKSIPETFLTYEEWFEIFEKFKDSGIKLMPYIYETMSKKGSDGNLIHPAWTNEQIRSISEHQAFYGWVAEDEVTYNQFDQNLAWITRYHNRVYSDKTRMWPNMSITFLPKSKKLINQPSIGGDYDNYLETYAKSADIFFADMYPTASYKGDKQYYNVAEDGKTVYSSTEGGENWHSYLQSHINFTNNHPESVHRLYLHVCKHVAKEANTDKLYVARYKPTEETLKVQSYANLMAGSNGLMLFVIVDIPENVEYKGFTEAAFSVDLKPNEYTYNLMSGFYNSEKFKNFKKIMTNLHVDDILYYNSDNLFNDENNEFINSMDENSMVYVGYAHNQTTNYCTILNLSLTDATSVTIKNGNYIMDVENGTRKKSDEKETHILNPGEILMIKREIQLEK